MKTFWMQNGKIVTDANGAAILCEECPCEVPGTCPTDCTECQDTFTIDISGLTGICAAMNTSTGNAGPMNIPRTGDTSCIWEGNSGGFPYNLTWDMVIGCVDGRWVVLITLVTVFEAALGYYFQAGWTGFAGDGPCPSLGVLTDVTCTPPGGNVGCGYAPYPPGGPPITNSCDNLPTLTLGV